MRGRQALWPVLLALAVAGSYSYFHARLRVSAMESRLSRGQVFSEEHFAPAENLERIDVERLATAHARLDIAMYSFTDKYIAEQIVRLAERGTVVRIYRDREQFENEARNAAQHHDTTTTEMFQGQRNIHVRVKQSSRHDLMHLKAYAADGRLLRDGSANWSVAGEKAQDNNTHFTNDPAQVRAFEELFAGMWSRPGNRVVQ